MTDADSRRRRGGGGGRVGWPAGRAGDTALNCRSLISYYRRSTLGAVLTDYSAAGFRGMRASCRLDSNTFSGCTDFRAITASFRHHASTIANTQTAVRRNWILPAPPSQSTPYTACGYLCYSQCSRIRILRVFFQISKNVTF